ncbi:SusC/RagA family TonB-linked outer membrane protein [Parapedobacter soli]|uniref:SusC/RagA family TonB-linked outer membrane protein n=1 Tax=Parapedobacter soli TaxID=416955 RepID=UPI0021CA6405|nr:TonB-dependent receptor [Parapedobacter soli]
MRKIYYLNFCLLVVLVALGGRAYAQEKIVGKVTEQNSGEPLAGVTVAEKHSNRSTVTDEEGEYSIDVGANAILVFSYVGFPSLEEHVDGRLTINIQLGGDANMLDEVVAIGYGSNRKQDLSVAVSSVSVDDRFKGRPASLGNIIQGEMPGVRVQQSGDPRATDNISIRGRGNRAGDGVLYVVDGVPNAPFNPADIETVTVLKDAASSAIYGAYAGSGGVIVITTKKARAGTLRVDANAWNGVQQAWRTPEVLTAEDFNRVWKDASAAAGRSVPATYDPDQFPYGNVTRTDWVDEIFRSGRMQHYDVTISGGSESLNALASLAYDDVDGTLLNTWNKNLTARLNLGFKFNNWVSLNQSLLYGYSNGQSEIGSGHTGAVFSAMAYPRFNEMYEYDDLGNQLPSGTVPRWALAEGFSVEADLLNPVSQLLNTRQHNPTNRVFSLSSLIIKPINGLEFKSDFSYNTSNFRGESFTGRFTAPGRTIDENFRSIRSLFDKNWNWENILSYSKTFNGKHYLSALGAFTMNYSTERSHKVYTRGYQFEYPHYVVFENAADWSSDRPEELIWEESIMSQLARVSYSYDDRYFLTGSIRRDASSKLNPSDNADVFPAASVAWKVTSEPFMPQSDAVSFLKVRASWGQVGNVRSVRRFIYAPPYSLGDVGVFLGENTNRWMFGLYQGTIPNPNLKWERTEQANLGVDLGFFNNKLNLTADYFSKKTKDLIESLPVPSVAGVASPPETNIGQVENTGFEFSLAYKQQFGDWHVDVRGNLGTVKNKVLNIGKRTLIAHSEGVNSMQPLQSTVGQPWYSYYLIEANGIFQTQEEINNYTWMNPETGETSLIQPSAKPGDIRFVDHNNDGIINDGDRQYMGAYDYPDFSYGFTLGTTWKGFSLSMFWQGVSGVNVFNGVRAMSSSGLKGWNMTTDILQSFEYNPNSGIPRLSFIDDPNGNYSKVSSYFLEKADYLRLKNVNLAYTLPSSLVGRIGGTGQTSIRVYANAENVLTLTDYSAFDPEVGNLGIDGGRFPVSRMFSLGINVSF